MYEQRLREINCASDGMDINSSDKVVCANNISNSNDLMLNLLCNNATIATTSHGGDDYDVYDSSIKNLVDRLEDVQQGRGGGGVMINSIYTNTIYGNDNSMKNSVNVVGSNSNNNNNVSVNINVNFNNSSDKYNVMGGNNKSPSIMMTAQQSKVIQNVVSSQ